MSAMPLQGMWLDEVNEVIVSAPPNSSWVPEWLEVMNEKTLSTLRVYPECPLSNPAKGVAKPVIRMSQLFKPLTDKYTVEAKTGTMRNAGTDAGSPKAMQHCGNKYCSCDKFLAPLSC
jgi:hypothetical protein